MIRVLMLLVVVVGLPAGASNSDVGRSVFESNCSRCHTAEPAGARKTPAAEKDNLALWLSSHSSAELREWVKDPSAVRKETLCDTRRLKASEVSDLLSYLRGAQAPSTPAP